MKKKYWDMNTAELADATREFDKEFVAENSKPLTAADKSIHRRPGRPKIGKGAFRINVTVEQSLLLKADRFAKSHGLTRSQLIAHALRHEITNP
jgi:hypothetical protein